MTLPATIKIKTYMRPRSPENKPQIPQDATKTITSSHSSATPLRKNAPRDKEVQKRFPNKHVQL